MTDRAPRSKQWITEAHVIHCGLQVSSTALPSSDVDLPVRVLNPKNEDIKLDAGTVIFDLVAVEVCKPQLVAASECDSKYETLPQARGIEYMEEFDFHVIHRPRSHHGNADAVLRKPCRIKHCHCDVEAQ